MARVAKYGKKKDREVSVSEEGWMGALAIASIYGCTSVSDLLEQLGRNPGWMKPKESGVEDIDCVERVKTAIASVHPTIPIKSRAAIARAFKKLTAKLEYS